MLLIDRSERKAFVKMEITKNGLPYIKNYELVFFAELGFKQSGCNVYRACDSIKWAIEDMEDWANYDGDFYDVEIANEENEAGLERIFDYEIL